MSNYYVSPTGLQRIPFSSVENGAHTMQALLENIKLSTGDTIYLHGEITESEIININVRDINIIGNIGSKLNLGVSSHISIDASGVSLSNMIISSMGKSIDIISDRCSIDALSITSNSSSFVDVISFNESQQSIVSNTTITLYKPSNAIVFDSCDACDILNCVVRLGDVDGGSGESYGGIIVSNSRGMIVKGNLVSTSRRYTKLCSMVESPYSIITRNVFVSNTLYSKSLIFDCSIAKGNGTISNNVFRMRQFSNYSTCLICDTSDLNHMDIVNNIFDCESLSSNVAMEIGIVDGILDNSCLYRFRAELEVIYTTVGGIEHGRHAVALEPIYSGDVQLTPQVYSAYMLSSQSPLIGIGYNFSVIGIYSIVTQEVDIVDSLLVNGMIDHEPTTRLVLLNSVLGNSVNEIDSFFGVTDYYDKEVYGNQFGFSYPTPFPFTSNSSFYNKDIKYIIKHRNLLSPFIGIGCPPNTGYGFPLYEGYPNDLFGNGRISYSSACGGYGEIIQDTINDDNIIQTTINSTDVIQNMI